MPHQDNYPSIQKPSLIEECSGAVPSFTTTILVTDRRTGERLGLVQEVKLEPLVDPCVIDIRGAHVVQMLAPYDEVEVTILTEKVTHVFRDQGTGSWYPAIVEPYEKVTYQGVIESVAGIQVDALGEKRYHYPILYIKDVQKVEE